jgi:choline dehydrogenase-like flavoprotein
MEKFFTMGIHLGNPLPCGCVHITSSSAPTSSSGISIDPNFFSHPLDMKILACHVQLAKKIASTEPLSRHLKPGGKRSPGMRDSGAPSDLEKAKTYVLERAAGAHHWMGSCAMMSQELGGIVDPELRVYGCPNLRVCDASIIPLAPRSNPQGVIYGVAEHGAQKTLSTVISQVGSQVSGELGHSRLDIKLYVDITENGK